MNLEKFFRDDLQIDDEFLVKALVKISQPIYLEKGALLVRQDEKQEDFLFLVSGIFRGFYLDANGKDVTDCFGVASGTPGMSVSIDNGISPISIEAATECVFIRIPGRELFPLVDTHPLLLKRYISIMQTAMQISTRLAILHQNSSIWCNQHALSFSTERTKFRYDQNLPWSKSLNWWWKEAS